MQGLLAKIKAQVELFQPGSTFFPGNASRRLIVFGFLP